VFTEIVLASPSLSLSSSTVAGAYNSVNVGLDGSIMPSLSKKLLNYEFLDLTLKIAASTDGCLRI